jgi:hypothetical protein
MNRLNEDENTRNMLDIIRESRNKDNDKIFTTLINEQTEYETAEDTTFDGEEDLDPAERKEEEEKFRQSVHPRCEFYKFKLYPNAQNVEFSGKFTDSQIEWFYSLDDTRGVYMTTDMLQLRDDTLETIKKLVGYYKSWSDEWANRIADEYNSAKDAETEEESTGFEPGDDLPDIEEPMV